MKQFIAMIVAAIMGFFKKLFGRDNTPAVQKERTARTISAEAALVEAKIRLDAAEALLRKTRHNVLAKAYKAYRQALAWVRQAEMEVLGCETEYDISIDNLKAAEEASEKAVKAYEAAHERLEKLRKELLIKSARAAAAQRNNKGRKSLDEEAAAKYAATLSELDAAKAALTHATKMRGMWQGHANRRHDPVSVKALDNWLKAEALAKANIARLESKLSNLENVAIKTLSMESNMTDLGDEIFALEAEITAAEAEQAERFNALMAANEAVNVAKKTVAEAAKALRAAIRDEAAARRELKRHEAWEAAMPDDLKRAIVAFRKAQKAYAEAQEAVRKATEEDKVEETIIGNSANMALTANGFVNNTASKVKAMKDAEAKLRAARIQLAENKDSITLQHLVTKRERELEKAQDSLRRCNELYVRLAERGEAVRIVMTTEDGNTETIWANSADCAADTIAKYLEKSKAHFAKVRLISNDSEEISFFERENELWRPNASPKAKTRFATAVTKHKGHGGYSAGVFDRTGKGNMPEWYVILKFGRLIVRAQEFDGEVAAKNAFGDLNAACRYTAFRAQLFHYMALERETGDHIDRDDAVADDLARIIMARFEAAGITSNRVAAIMDNMYDGSIRSLKWICTMNADAFQEIDGIGKKTAKLAEEALAGFVLSYRATEHIELSKSPMIPVRKYILNKDGSVTETIVHVKLSPLFHKVQELAAEKAVKANVDVPAMLPLVVFEHQVKLGKKEKPEDSAAIKELRKKVREGWLMEDGLFRAALHGTNAGKLCRTWWIREDLVDEAIRFCSTEASTQAQWTAAKRNAYLGLMGVGTTPIDLTIGAEHIAFIPNLTIEVKDNVVFVAGKAVGTVEELSVFQKSFDGFMLGHISEKLEKEFLKNAKNAAERKRIRKAIVEFHKHGSTIRYPGVKGLCDTSIDWHAQFHAWGIHKVVDMFGRELDIDDIAIIADAGVFKFSIGENGTHPTYEAYIEKCHELGHSIGRLVMEKKAHVSWLPTQQLQTLAGVPEFVVRRLAEVAANYMANLRTADGVVELLPGIEGELVKACPQIAAHWYFSERLQEAYQKNEWLVYAGKIPGVSTGHFVAPDPFAFMAWAAFRDLEKVKEYSELGKYEVRCADTAGKCDGIGTAIMSRNPSTDLGAQVEVTVYTEFSTEAEKYILRKSSIVYTSIWDTSATRLRMDFDGDHVNLCWLQGVIEGVRMTAQLWYGMDRAPVIDWVPPEGKKNTLSDEDLLAYFEGLWQGSELGLRMDTLTKIYNAIPCGGEIQDWHREAVAWLTYAVNVLVDASKHGGEQIEEPESVRKAEDLLMAKAIAFGKVKAGKSIDFRNVCAKLGNGIIDTYAKMAKAGIQSKFALDGCDYTKVFDPRCILGDKNTGEAASVQMQRIAIYNLCADSRWSYYAYLRDADGHLTTELDDEPTPVSAYFGSIKEAADNQNIGVGSIVGIRDVELGTNQVGVLSYDEEDGTYFLNEIPGKWVIRERWETTTREGETLVHYSGFLGILQGRYAEAEKAMREDEHADMDYIAARRWTEYATRESMAAYAALYGYDEEDAMVKTFLWLFGGNQHSRWDIDLFLRAYAKEVGLRLGVAENVAMAFDPENNVGDDSCPVVVAFDESSTFGELTD